MKKVVENWLFSVVGVVALLIILVALNVLGNFKKFRWDLTENHLYTLSQGSQRIVQKLDTPVEIRFYYSKDNASTPVYLRTYAQEVEDLLAEFQQTSHGKIKIVKLDPKPDSDAEDSARLDGVEGQTVNLSDKVSQEGGHRRNERPAGTRTEHSNDDDAAAARQRAVGVRAGAEGKLRRPRSAAHCR